MRLAYMLSLEQVLDTFYDDFDFDGLKGHEPFEFQVATRMLRTSRSPVLSPLVRMRQGVV